MYKADKYPQNAHSCKRRREATQTWGNLKKFEERGHLWFNYDCFPVYVRFAQRAHSWQKASRAATNVSLLHITANWSAAAVRIIPCRCLQLGSKGTTLGRKFFTRSSFSPPPLRSTNESYVNQMLKEKPNPRRLEKALDREREKEREMNLIKLDHQRKNLGKLGIMKN